ncbi:Unknown protein [Striga hermonthica]|uniref:F-box protein At3g26010-like beta-propeller domain-containing protein n=1 Tax=Striga hermonthica TaxID=68872 RepID=A0A9N7N3D4_STRHE|nr:Unknown protein [Striga hermonthica]
MELSSTPPPDDRRPEPEYWRTNRITCKSRIQARRQEESSSSKQEERNPNFKSQWKSDLEDLRGRTSKRTQRFIVFRLRKITFEKIMVTGSKKAQVDRDAGVDIFDGEEWKIPEMKQPPAVAVKDPIMQHILPYLPAKALMRFRSVSKSWDRWIRRPILAHHQARTHKSITGFFCQSLDSGPTFLTLDWAACGIPSHSLPFLPNSTYLVASTHGLLVCLTHFGPDIYYICNPVTRAVRALPRPGLYHGLKAACVLAFDSAPENIESYYQLVCAVHLVHQPVVCFETYSSETGLWTCSNAICPEVGPYEYFSTGLYMKGVAYWHTTGRKVVAFDPKIDVCQVLALPEESPARGVLVEMEGEIAYVGISEQHGVGYVLKMYYGVEMRLVKKVNWFLENVGSFGCNYGVLPYYEKGRLLVMVGGMVYWCGLGDERFEKVVGCEASESTVHHRIFPYVNSLVYLS